MCACDQFRAQVKALLAVMTIMVVLFDLAADIYALTDYFTYRSTAYDDGLTFALLAVCVLSTGICALEIRNGVMAYRIARRDYQDEDDATIQERWTETVALLQTLLEDLPFALILYLTYEHGSCALNMQVFETSLVGQIGLFGAVASSSWKVLYAVIDCCCCGHCGTEFNKRLKCLLIRSFRAMVACLVLAFACYLFFRIYLREGPLGTDLTPRCVGPNTDI